MVSVTYGHGNLYDFNITDAVLLADWTEHENGNTATYTISGGDAVYLNVTATGGAAEYYIDNDDVLSLSTTIYTTILWRYMTKSASQAKIVAYFNDVSTQTVLDQSASPSWSYTQGYATLTAGKTLDKIRLHADVSTGSVYYDYVLVCKGIFTFPNATRLNRRFQAKNPYIMIPAMSGDDTQSLGSKLVEVDLSCDLDVSNDTSDWLRPQGTLAPKTDVYAGQVFDDILHEGGRSEPWQWLNYERGAIKASLEDVYFRHENRRNFADLIFREKRVSSAGGEYLIERLGLNL